MMPSSRACPSLLLLLAAARGWGSAEGMAVQIGFCMEYGQMGGLFWGTGYTGTSTILDQETCELGGHLWCPLMNYTDLWFHDMGDTSVQYYWFSTCCMGRSMQYLTHKNGRPTCREGADPEDCAYHDWAAKVVDELTGPESMYEVSVSPGTPEIWTNWTDHNCICAPDDGRCIKKGTFVSPEDFSESEICLVCETDVSCGPNPVRMGFQLFKVVNADVRTSDLSLSVWLRQEWADRRLTYNRQCYGNIATVPMQAKSGSLSQSKIWSPDIELYNYKNPIWGGFNSRLATVHACDSDKPSKQLQGCGKVTWSAPGIVTALCKYKGLAAFPYDILSCEMELAAWSQDGRAMDIMRRKQDGGISWVDDPTNPASGGSIAGSSYQDYTINSISLRRIVSQYECCLNQPFPGLIYEFSFKRSGQWYEQKLVLPLVCLTMLSFLAFWIPPHFAERMVFSALVVWAVVTHDVILTDFQPICTESTFLGYLSNVSQSFVQFAVFETAIVMWIRQQRVDTWTKALLPFYLRRLIWRRKPPILTNPDVIRRDEARMEMKKGAAYQDSKEAQIRDQYYRKLFIHMDRTYSGFLEPEDLIFFGSFIAGSRFRNWRDLAFLRVDPHADLVNYEDFVTLCETKIENIDNTEFLKQTVENYIQVADTREEVVNLSWEDTAGYIDSWARWSVPFAYICFLGTLYDVDYASMIRNRFAVGAQVLLMITPIWPMIIIGGACGLIHFLRVRRMKQIKKICSGDATDNGSSWYRSYSIEQMDGHRDDAAMEDASTTGTSLSAKDSAGAQSKKEKFSKDKDATSKSGSSQKTGGSSSSTAGLESNSVNLDF